MKKGDIIVGIGILVVGISLSVLAYRYDNIIDIALITSVCVVGLIVIWYGIHVDKIQLEYIKRHYRTKEAWRDG